MEYSYIFAVAVYICTVNATVLPTLQTTKSNQDPNRIFCHKCTNALALSDCTSMVICDRQMEECYMEQILTDSANVVYNAGCRARAICSAASGSSSIGSGVGKRSSLVMCSQCCDREDRCNRRLCGIPEGTTLGVTSCYECDHRTQNSEQYEVRNPQDCMHMSTCNPNEMCLISTTVVGGKSEYFYGCYSKAICKVLMTRTFEDLKTCYGKNLSDPNLPQDIREACGDVETTRPPVGKRDLRSVNVCHACCGDSGCNYGDCNALRDRLFVYYQNNLLDMNTLRLKTSSALIGLLCICFSKGTSGGNVPVTDALSPLPTIPIDTNVILCHKCVRAKNLADCTRVERCDRITETCGFPQWQPGNIVGRKRDITTCIRCCKNEDNCNKRLCGITEGI